MPHPFIVGRLDIAELCLWTFGLFFFGLVIYLRREDRREGYPLEDEITGRLQPVGTFLEDGPTKMFRLPHGHGTRIAPNPDDRDALQPVGVRRSFLSAGAPYEPTGNPLVDGVGPAAWVDRPKYPQVNMEGTPLIVPIGSSHGRVRVAREDADPRGYTVIGCDRRIAGTCSDIWVDSAERLIRYLQITLGEHSGAPGRVVLAPMTMCDVSRRNRSVMVDAIRADQFGLVPGTALPDQVTMYEEERIMGYYGGGYLYATASRMEPLI